MQGPSKAKTAGSNPAEGTRITINELQILRRGELTSLPRTNFSLKMG